jgi:uncharacterized repeat protein (TIGR01451 family)
MITNIQTKVISLFVLASLILTATFLWPIRALADGPICSGPLNLPIPDSLGQDVPGTPITSTLIITNPALINDLDVIISTTHTYVGDLVFTLTHKIDPTITSTAIISRPLYGQSAITLPSEVACSGDDIFVTLDDEAVNDIQVDCTEGTLEGDGTKAYIDGQLYRPYSPLSIFDTDTLSGTWELTITDYYQDDIGSLAGWCLVPTVPVEPPDLQISKDDGGITVTPGNRITYTLTYTNSGGVATGVVITETVPANTSFNAASSLGWQQVGATSQYTYPVGSVGPSQTITFVVAVNNPLPGGVSVITNTVQIGDNGANGADQDLSDNQDEETTPTAITSQKIYLPLILRNN